MNQPNKQSGPWALSEKWKGTREKIPSPPRRPSQAPSSHHGQTETTRAPSDLPHPIHPAASGPSHSLCHVPPLRLRSTAAESPMPMRAAKLFIIGRTPHISPPSCLARPVALSTPPLGISALRLCSARRLPRPPPLLPPPQGSNPRASPSPPRRLSSRGTSSPPAIYSAGSSPAPLAPSVAAQRSSSDPRVALRYAPPPVRPRAAIALSPGCCRVPGFVAPPGCNMHTYRV